MLAFHSYTLHDAYTMTPRQFKRLRLALGMKQEELAEELEVSRVSVTRYENGTIVVPRPIVKLLKYIAEENGRAA